MSERPSDATPASDAAGVEPLVVVPSIARSAVAFALSATFVFLLMGTIQNVTGWRSEDWSELLIRSPASATLAALMFAWFAPPRERRAIVVSDGFVSGPRRSTRARIQLGQLDRVRIAADLASRWRWLGGIRLRSSSGAAIHVDWSAYKREDRELLLRALGVAPAGRA